MDDTFTIHTYGFDTIHFLLNDCVPAFFDKLFNLKIINLLHYSNNVIEKTHYETLDKYANYDNRMVNNQNNHIFYLYILFQKKFQLLKVENFFQIIEIHILDISY